MFPAILLLLLFALAAYFINFKNLISIFLSGLFALTLAWMPAVISPYLMGILGGNYVLAYLASIGMIILFTYVCFKKEIEKNRFLNFFLGLGLLFGLIWSFGTLFFRTRI